MDGCGYRPESSVYPAVQGHTRAESAGRALLLALPAALVGYTGFSNGGFFLDTTATAAIVACLALLLRVTLPHAPASGLRPLGVALGGALALFIVWTLLSATWSGAPARALFEFDRGLLYLLVLGLLAAVPRGSDGPRWVLRALAVALAVVALAGLLTRLSPEAFADVELGAAPDRLAWPVGYWNALGLVAGLAGVLALWLASDLDEPRPVRILAAAVLPALAVAVYLTLSRGAIGAAAAGILAFVVLGRPRGLITALPAVALPTAYAVARAYDLDVLVDGFDPRSAAAAAAGSDLTRATLLACGAAAVLRALGTLADAPIARPRIGPPPLRVRVGIWAGSAAIVAVLAVVLGAPAAAERQWERFTSPPALGEELNGRDRLGALSNNGRLEHWRTARDAWQEEPLRGQGAGTFPKLWDADPRATFEAQDAHSLYLETLAELGVVGLVLLAAVLACGFAAVILRRLEDRVLWSAALAVAIAWAVRAGADWDWEMPVVTLPVLAIFGMACAGRAARPPGRLAAIRPARVVAGLAVLLLALTPVQLLRSQRDVERALASFRAGDCTRASDAALGALSAIDSRTEPFEILGYCDVRAGQPDLARRMLTAALRRDPDNWELLYGLALVRASDGKDPRPVLRRARAANPREPMVDDALRRMRSRRPAVWRREALASTLPIAPGPVATR